MCPLPVERSASPRSAFSPSTLQSSAISIDMTAPELVSRLNISKNSPSVKMAEIMLPASMPSTKDARDERSMMSDRADNASPVVLSSMPSPSEDMVIYLDISSSTSSMPALTKSGSLSPEYRDR